MKARSARVARRIVRNPRLRDELAAALWELRKLERVRLENETLYVLLADAYARIAQRNSVAAKLQRERDEQRAALWRDYHGDPGSP
jgi:hypothetical protein